MEKKESDRPIYICPEFKNGISNLFFALEHPEYYTKEFPAKKRYLFFGQAGLQKEAQIEKLMAPKIGNYTVKELVLDADNRITVERISALVAAPTDIIIIRNIHFLVFSTNDPIIQKFAHGLNKLSNVIIGISDIPVDTNNIFYSQFQDFIVATTPTQDHLKSVFEFYFQSWKGIVEKNSLKINLEVTDEDYLWLAQQAAHCHDEDVKKFMHSLYHYTMEQLNSDSESEVVISRSMIEDVNNGFMFSLQNDGVLTITQRDAVRDQNIFTARANIGCVPRKRQRE